jgi:hypothetical protein
MSAFSASKLSIVEFVTVSVQIVAVVILEVHTVSLAITQVVILALVILASDAISLSSVTSWRVRVSHHSTIFLILISAGTLYSFHASSI